MRNTLITIGICLAIAGLGWIAPGVMNTIFNGIDIALGWAGPLAVVVIVSALTGVLFIMAFPHVSAQGRIAAVKAKISHNLLGIRIFQDDMPTVGRGVSGALGWNMVYLGLNALPMVVLAAPFMVVWFQLNSLYAFQPLSQGEQTVVVVEVAAGVDPAQVEIQMPAGASLVNRVNMVGKLAFTLSADQVGSSDLVLRHGGIEVTKALEINTSPNRLARMRTSEPWSNFIAAKDPIIYFGEPVLPADSPIVSVWIEYPPAPLGPFGGGEITIMLIFVLVSMAFGFGLKGYFGVEI